jgi:hypothetical protein
MRWPQRLQMTGGASSHTGLQIIFTSLTTFFDSLPGGHIFGAAIELLLQT